MIAQILEHVRTKFPAAWAENDGSITVPECPICLEESHPHKRIKLFVNDTGKLTGISCARFASAGQEANREHCAPIRVMLGFGKERKSALVTETLFDGTLSLEATPAERGKTLVVARNCKSDLHRDVIDLNRGDHRTQFIKALGSLEQNQQKEIHAALLRLATRYERTQSVIDIEEASTRETKQTIFAALSDGRLIEQLANGVFAIYNPARGEVTYSRKAEDDLNSYEPLRDDFVLRGGLFLPERLIEYGDEAALDAEIEACIKRYADVPSRELRLSAKYVRLTYIADKLNEISYLRAIGERGSGKSRYICTVGMLCLRPIAISSPSSASLFRMMDAYQPTLILDECNLAVGSEDTDMLIQILNSGFQRITYIPRIEKGADGQMSVKLFSPFGPKLIGGLKLSDSGAFESRCVRAELQKTRRKDIPFRMSERMLRDFAELRAKLYLWRLRNWNRDYERAFDEAERELKEYQIEPRFIQIAIPVYGLMNDPQLKSDFARLLENRTNDAASDKQESFDGLLVSTVHRLLFEVDDEDQATWKPFGSCPLPGEGQPIELATIEQITATLNDGIPEKKQYLGKWISRELGKLGFRRKEIKRRASFHYRKSAIVFERETFAKIFGNYLLALPQDFTLPTPPIPSNNNDHNEMRWAEHLSTTRAPEPYPAHHISLPELNLQELSGVGGMNAPQEGENISTKPFPQRNKAFSGLVALEAQTEPLDEARGSASHTTKMIGLALSYDGNEQTTYVTDQEAWPLLMPEPEQRALFHNAKSNLGVLESTGLPLPTQWEDTMIAAHLLDETGQLAIKSLAKEQLGLNDPATFDQDDQNRLLDPNIFEKYACNATRYTFHLWPKLQRELHRQGLQSVYELEKAIIPAVLAMENAGLKLDLTRMSEMRATVERETKRIEAEIYEQAGCRFDLHSPQKVATILFDKLGVPSCKETDSGQRCVDKEALEDVRGYHPVVDGILRYRQIDKLASTFLTVLPKFADANERIHPEFKPLGATSGRFSCSNPNVQQIPSRSELGKKLRQMFITDEGNALVVADWSQMELRILAHYSQDPLLLEAYTSGAETDLHTLSATRMFGKVEADITKTERSIAKMINFGIAYGITPNGLFNRLRSQGLEVTQKDCEQFIEDYFKTYAGIRRFLNQVENKVRERGYVKNWFGRRRRVSGRTMREVRQAQNFVIQATAADLAKTAMVRLHTELPEGARLIAMVHDEFLVECRAEQAEDVRQLMIEVMETTPAGFRVPMAVEAQVGVTWGDCK